MRRANQMNKGVVGPERSGYRPRIESIACDRHCSHRHTPGRRRAREHPYPVAARQQQRNQFPADETRSTRDHYIQRFSQERDD